MEHAKRKDWRQQSPTARGLSFSRWKQQQYVKRTKAVEQIVPGELDKSAEAITAELVAVTIAFQAAKHAHSLLVATIEIVLPAVWLGRQAQFLAQDRESMPVCRMA